MISWSLPILTCLSLPEVVIGNEHDESWHGQIILLERVQCNTIAQAGMKYFDLVNIEIYDKNRKDSEVELYAV